MASLQEGFENLDLESGGNTVSEEVVGFELVWSERAKTKFFSSDLGGFLSSSESNVCNCGIQSSSSLDNSGGFMNNGGELKLEMNSEREDSQGHGNLAQKTCEDDRLRKNNSRNALKPPRPPKGPSLDAADQKLVREIIELARRKRARIEHMKAAKKMKASKPTPAQNGISAMIFSLLFLFVIFLQGRPF